jgi:hypothetical protein
MVVGACFQKVGSNSRTDRPPSYETTAINGCGCKEIRRRIGLFSSAYAGQDSSVLSQSRSPREAFAWQTASEREALLAFLDAI